jgi:hypothetical protein
VRDVDFDVPDLRAVVRPPFVPAAFFCAVVPARPPFAPAWRTVALRRLVVLRADVVLRALVLRAVVFRGVVFRAAVFRVVVFRVVVFFRAAVVLRLVVLRAVVFFRDELPPVELEPDLVSPFWARSLLTVRAAISFARFVERPCFCSESLMCSY